MKRAARERGTLGGEMCRAKSLRIGVHHADAAVWGPVRGESNRSFAPSTQSIGTPFEGTHSPNSGCFPTIAR
eukprot:30915-Pelagococcus_subviridis.AAC.5